MTSKEWKTYKLSDFIEFNPRETLAKGTVAKKIAMENLQPFCRDVCQYECAPYNGGVKFKNGDTIMARITPCLENGKTSKINILEDDEIAFGSTEYIVFRKRDNISDENFIYYLVTSPKIREIAIKSMVGSSGRQRVQADVLANLELELPPLETQEKIARVLSSLDDKIELNNKINQNLEQQADLLFNDLFLEDKDCIKLSEVISTTSGGTPSRKNLNFYTNGSFCWVKSKELNGTFITETEEKINQLAIEKSSAKLLPPYSVLLAMYGATVGEYAIISKQMTCNQAICAIIPNEKYPYTYIYEYIKLSKERIKTLAIGSAQQNISQVLIKDLLVHKNINKIKEYHFKTRYLFELIKNNQIENEKLKQLRDTLLPKLMSGEIDVSKRGDYII